MSNRMRLDANVLLRVATGAPEEVAIKAKQLFQSVAKQNIKLIVPTLVAAECCWVLSGVYEFNRFQIRDGLSKIFSLPFIELEDSFVLKALNDYAEKNIDFIDAYLGNSSKEIPIITWNEKHFKRLPCEFFTPEQMLDNLKSEI
ncbi:PIN domain-containing protein [Bacillus sp. CECT 9360]|uniref:PIN domain-containing protein n=1 Tax=Bacillus sp. CECT 9360 TaxID=2845821 RepID=UPI001E5B3699|nr:PIN domain-containing protein [Bacillus sp. CECT 9360]